MPLSPVEVEASMTLPGPLPHARPITGSHSDRDKPKRCPCHAAGMVQLPMLSPQHEVTEAFHNPKAAQRSPVQEVHPHDTRRLEITSHMSEPHLSTILLLGSFLFFFTAVELSFNTPDLYQMSFYLKIRIHGNRTALHNGRQFTAQQRTRTGRKQPIGR